MMRWLVMTGLVGCPSSPTPPVPTEAPPGLRIAEVMSGNDTFLRDPAGDVCPEFDDWVELENTGEVPVQLATYTLADSGTSWSLPEQELGAGEVLLVWADEQPEQGPLHAPFAVKASGERLELRRGDEAIDGVEVPALQRDHAYARQADGSWRETSAPSPGRPNQGRPSTDPCARPAGGFDDHTWPCIATEEGFADLAGDRHELQVVKFDILAFDDPAERSIVYVDSTFYELHDQYYLFRMFNGQTFQGLDRYPPYDGDFQTWEELEDWARTVVLADHVPVQQARFAGERLYSPYFYATINGPQRTVGVGTLVHRPATETTEAFWGFELAHADAIDHAALSVYFEVLEQTGPAAFRDLRWLVRSPEQELLAQTMEAEALPYADRIARYDELSPPGTVEVYNPGITAGRLLRIGAGASLDDARPTDILLLDTVPDVLPPCAGLVTSAPQTPLSHIALLARSRGIPNLHIAGVSEDPRWDAWARVQTRIALEASPDGTYRATALNNTDYLRWRSLSTPTVPQLVPVDTAGLPLTLALDEAAPMLDLRGQVGGKAAGLRLLLDLPGVDTPDTPLALTLKGYEQHLAQLDWLPDLLEAAPFGDPNAARQRFLVLEGADRYGEVYPTLADASLAESFLALHPEHTHLGRLARAGGLRGEVATTPLPTGLGAQLTTALEDRFGWMDPTEGLRFRSSSTVEDAEGFNGAGLYISRTGFLQPAAGERPALQAIAEVWGAYWGAEAFEERETAGIAHLDGGMGVLVHPRFDDAYESANLVFTATRLPDGSHEVVVNAQAGAVSVANPPSTCPPVLPETVRLRDTNGTPAIERLGASTEIGPDEVVLDDHQLLTVFAAGVAALDAWRAQVNAEVPVEEAREVLVLDLEARLMAPGWLGSAAERLVVKQARSLEPGVAGMSGELDAVSVPRDVLARADRIERHRCWSERMGLSVYTVYTDPLAVPPMGYDEQGLVASLRLVAIQDVPELGLSAGQVLVRTHLDVLDATFGTFTVDVDLVDGSVVGGPSLTVDLAEGTVSEDSTCLGETLWSSPDAFLEGLLP